LMLNRRLFVNTTGMAWSKMPYVIKAILPPVFSHRNLRSLLTINPIASNREAR
jgi:hypothetical protein